jgi:hypothetical protein
MKGQAINFVAPPEANKQSDTCFRVLSCYESDYDEIATRLDIKIGVEQFNVALYARPPEPPKAGDKFRRDDDLISPNSGVLECLNVKVNRLDLIIALKELVRDLESVENKQQAA